MAKVCLLVIVLAGCISSSFGQFTQQLGPEMTQVSASINYLWAVHSSNKHVFRCDRPCNGLNWMFISGAALVQIDASDDEVWGVDSDNTVWKRPVDGSGSWQEIPGSFKHVTASGKGFIWGVNPMGNIYHCKKPCTGTWVNVPGGLKQIDGGQKYVYGVNDLDELYSRPVDGSGGWRAIPGVPLSYVSASGLDDIFGVDSSNIAWRCKKPCLGEWEMMTGQLQQCDATSNGVFGISPDKRLYRHMIGGWSLTSRSN